MLAKNAPDAPFFNDSSQKSVSALINSALSVARSAPARRNETDAKSRTTPRRIFIPNSFRTAAFDRANVYNRQAYPRQSPAQENRPRPPGSCVQREWGAPPQPLSRRGARQNGSSKRGQEHRDDRRSGHL